MWSGGTRTTETKQALTIYVTNIPQGVTVADVTALFQKALLRIRKEESCFSSQVANGQLVDRMFTDSS